MSVLAAYAVPHPPLAVPGVGRGREEEIAATVAALREVARRIRELEPETIVVSSPHATAYLDYLHLSGGRGARGTFASFGDAADGSEVAYNLEKTGERQYITLGEHTVRWMRLERMQKSDDPSAFPALIEWEVFGRDA